MPEIGLHDERVRVTCHLPCSNDGEEKALRDVFKYLHGQRTASVPVTGYTHTALRPPTFSGWWFGKAPDDEPNAKKRWVQDDVVIVMVDYRIKFSDHRLSRLVKELHNALVAAYECNGCPQTEFWITTHQIVRYA